MISPSNRYAVRRAVISCITSDRGAIDRIAAIATVLSVYDTTVRWSHGSSATSPHVDARSSFSHMIRLVRSSSVHSPTAYKSSPSVTVQAIQPASPDASAYTYDAGPASALASGTPWCPGARSSAAHHRKSLRTACDKGTTPPRIRYLARDARHAACRRCRPIG
jgi:hypothetical protein